MNNRIGMKSGSAMICVLACLLVSSSLVFTSIQSAIRVRSEMKTNGAIRQTHLLADAGLYRALAKLHQSDEYQGEVWSPTGLANFIHSAEVVIEIQSTPKDKDIAAKSISVVVRAMLDGNSTNAIQVSRVLTHQSTQTHSK